ncbi:ACP S-malonyltransferase [Shimia sp. SDUM112013]|uniref:ACP S-malonyltransferase n=1 Tax=Shimia sp. SDUM112013 TaxID=3136160 RepID=UPI0032EEDE98
MRQTAVVVAPGRGTYNREELGYLGRYHKEKTALFEGFEAIRAEAGQEGLLGLDAADRYAARHQRGDNASGLIFACAYADFLSIDRDRFDILGVTGNSMGWYTALACAGAVSAPDGFRIANTMGALMQAQGVGGQLVYPFFDEDWRPIPGVRAAILAKVGDIQTRRDHTLDLSIDLGGMLVLAGNEAGLSAFEAEMPRREGRYPLRLPGHAAFHTGLQAPVAAEGQARLAASLFGAPQLPLIDGRGAFWSGRVSQPEVLRGYTLGTQVTSMYDFAAAIRVTARDLMPDVFIVLGPGNTLGASVAKSLIEAGWRGLRDKADFKDRQRRAPVVLSMGLSAQREDVTGP